MGFGKSLVKAINTAAKHQRAAEASRLRQLKSLDRQIAKADRELKSLERDEAKKAKAKEKEDRKLAKERDSHIKQLYEKYKTVKVRLKLDKDYDWLSGHDIF